MHRHALLAAAVLLAALTTACQRHEAAPAAAGDAPLSPVSSSTSSSSSSSSGDPIGVSECDDFLRAFHDCVDNKVPEASRADLNTQMESSIALWRQAASTPEGKAGLGVACSQNRDTMKSSLSQYGCSL